MTTRSDPDVVVHAFLLEGPDELPTRTIEVIRESVHQTPQRASRPWRIPTMPRPLLLFAALGAIILAAGAMFLAGSGGPAPNTAPSVAPSAPAAVPSAAAVVTPSTGPTPSPTVTPYPLADGEAWIAVESPNGILLIRPDGTGGHSILAALPGTSDRPTTLGWSPDGRQLAFEANGDRGSQIWIADVDGTNARQLTQTPDGCPFNTCVEGVQPAWSPDGTSIAYIAPTHVGGIFEATALMTVDVASGATTTVYATSDATLARPTWAPDGRSIALEVQRYPASVEIGSPNETVIGVIDLDAATPTPTEITDPGLFAGYPFWHPTDSLIVFRTNRFDASSQTLLDPSAPSDLYTIRPDGSGLTRVTDHPVGGPIVRGPSWTPDGQQIIFGKLADPSADEVLRVIDATGANEASATGDVITLGEGRSRPTP
jgi:dipeptidyl aminopeptidase/acylaminoacyl peptidase